VAGHPVITACAGVYRDTNLEPLDGCEAVFVDAYEPNDTEATATIVPSGGAIGGLTIHSATDVDWINTVANCGATDLRDDHGVLTGWRVECVGDLHFVPGAAAPGIQFAAHVNPSGVTAQFIWQHDRVFNLDALSTPPATETYDVEILGVGGAVGGYTLAGWR
jgi:hypothetical protein